VVDAQVRCMLKYVVDIDLSVPLKTLSTVFMSAAVITHDAACEATVV
jgi:hypothetical protein